MTPYRDETIRVTLPKIRAQYRPRDFRVLEKVVIEVAGVRAAVKLVRQRSIGTRGGSRRWLECPRCGAPTVVLGLVRNGWLARAERAEDGAAASEHP